MYLRDTVALCTKIKVMILLPLFFRLVTSPDSLCPSHAAFRYAPQPYGKGMRNPGMSLCEKKAAVITHCTGLTVLPMKSRLRLKKQIKEEHQEMINVRSLH